MAAIYSVDHALNYLVPAEDEVLLTAELAKTIQSFGKIKKDALHHLCIIAYGIRRQNLIKVTGRGGNQRGEAYKDEFRAWYEQYKISDVYGSLSGFTQYAMTGRLLTYTKWQVPKQVGLTPYENDIIAEAQSKVDSPEDKDNILKEEQDKIFRRKSEGYLAQLPASLGALYGLSKVVWEQGKEATDESRKAYRDLLVVPVRDGSTNNAFIHPAMTIADVDSKVTSIQSYCDQESNKPKVKDEMTISLATIKVHKDLYKFNRSGTKRTIAGPKIDDVRKLINQINNLLADHGNDKFSLKSNLDEVVEKYNNSESPDYSKNIGD